VPQYGIDTAGNELQLHGVYSLTAKLDESTQSALSDQFSP